jgi:hypothetical protein
MTKILTPSSDIDIAILDVPEPGSGQDMVDQLHNLDEKIREKNMVSYIEVISNAKVPIIKLDHRATGISVDVCINNSSGLTTGKIIRRLLRQYPPLKPLTMVLKMFLVSKQTQINRAASYEGLIFTLIISYLSMFCYTGVAFSLLVPAASERDLQRRHRIVCADYDGRVLPADEAAAGNGQRHPNDLEPRVSAAGLPSTVRGHLQLHPHGNIDSRRRLLLRKKIQGR